jgi:DNA processing protein
MTPYGARVARELAGALAASRIVIVSGLAQGIDSAAHEGALEGGGVTVAVLGAGLAAYLREARGRRRRLAYEIRREGALISQFPPDAPPRSWTFVERNGLIAALGEMTVVVEAPVGSGALITARNARDLGRPVYAVPGPIDASASGGANALIARGHAQAMTDVAALVESMGVAVRPAEDGAEAIGARVLDALAAGPADLDTLARRLGMSAATLASVAARLVVRGDLVATGGRLARR